MMNVLKLPWEGANIRGTKYKGGLAALSLGLIFGVGLGPCAFAFMAPVLGVVFQVSSTDTIYAGSLLGAFSLGHILVIILAGTLMRQVQKYLNWSETSKATKYVKNICGLLLLAAGVYFIIIA
jgi:cytochrome c-type biogenesis protein